MAERSGTSIGLMNVLNNQNRDAQWFSGSTSGHVAKMLMTSSALRDTDRRGRTSAGRAEEEDLFNGYSIGRLNLGDASQKL